MPKLEEIEDVEDIDNLEMDLAEFDPSLSTPIAPARPKPQVVRSQDDQASSSGFPSMGDQMPMLPGMDNNPFMKEMFKKLQTLKQHQDSTDDEYMSQKSSLANPQNYSEEQLEKIRSMEIIYPCYFDLNRSHKQGRRVNKDLAVENPLLKTIYDACLTLKVPAVFEATKTHPQDFGNPGRVRILRSDVDNSKVLPKRMLYKAIGEYLQKHPTTWNKVKELGGPPELRDYAGKDIPKVKGFKMNQIVPLHSAMIYQNPAADVIYKKEFLERPKPIVPPPTTNTSLPKQKNKYMQIRR